MQQLRLGAETKYVERSASVMTENCKQELTLCSRPAFPLIRGLLKGHDNDFVVLQTNYRLLLEQFISKHF